MPDAITITNDHTMPVDHFVIPTHYQNDLESVIVPQGLIQDRVEKMAVDISKDCSGAEVVACCVLKGAFEFFSTLTTHLKNAKTPAGDSIPMSFEFIKVKSYENDKSSGKVSISLNEEELKSFAGKELLVIEDIVDTGNTMVALIALLQKYKPAKIRVVTLLWKFTERSNDYVPDYVGFNIPDLFVVGYGLDYNEKFRDLKHIAVINDVGKAKYAV